MRLFVAVKLSERSKRLIMDKVNIIKKDIDQNISWVDRDKWHITLKFLGETPDKKNDSIKKAIKNTANNWQQVPIQLTGIAAFPHINNPRVVFVGINKGRKQLINIYNYLDKQLINMGFKADDRDFTPHLTIARIKKENNKNIITKKLKKYSNKYFINVYSPLEKIFLIKSTLRPDGAVYEELFSTKLKNS